MPEHSIGDIIESQTSSRFGHPDMLEAELREAIEYVRQLDQQRDELMAGLEAIAADPDLDDLEAHVEAQLQLQVIADVDNRRDAELARADAARERLAGGVRPATDAALWAPYRY
jgi:hypothetical protein